MFDSTVIDPAVALQIAHKSLPYFLGIFVSWTLHGASIVLLPNYLFTFRTNPLRERLFIIALVACNTVDVAFDLSRVIKVYVVHFGDATWLVSIHNYFENKFLYFSPVFIPLLCQMYFVRRISIFLRTYGGWLEEWRIVVDAVGGALVGGSAICGFVSQYIFFGYPNYVVAVNTVAAGGVGSTYNITHILWLLLGVLAQIHITFYLSLELARTRVWQRRTTQAVRESKNPKRSDQIYVHLRNGIPLLVISIISFILYLTQNKAWTFATGSLFPRLYSISVLLWTATPRPKKGSRFVSSSDPPDLTWTTSAPREITVSDRHHHSSPLWTMWARSSTAGVRGFKRKAALLRRGGGGGAAGKAAQPRQWVVDLEAEDQMVDKVDISHLKEDELDDGPVFGMGDGLNAADSVELQQWRESMRLGKQSRSSFASSSPATAPHLTTVRQRTSVPSAMPLDGDSSESPDNESDDSPERDGGKGKSV